MLPELLDLIVLLCDVDTIKNFVVSKHFYQYIGTTQFWHKKSKHERIHLVLNISKIENCQDPQHQHFPSSDKSHYNIHNWINYYKQCSHAKIQAINTILVNQIDFSINTDATINIIFKNKALLSHYIESDICKSMKNHQLTNWSHTNIKINPDKMIIKAFCSPFNIILTYQPDNESLINLLTTYYSDENAIITNEKNEAFKESHNWKVADYLGHLR